MALFDFLWFFGNCFTGYRHLPATEATRQALPGEGHWPQSESPADGHPQVPGRLCLLCAHQHQRYMHSIHTWSKNYFPFSLIFIFMNSFWWSVVIFSPRSLQLFSRDISAKSNATPQLAGKFCKENKVWVQSKIQAITSYLNNV